MLRTKIPPHEVGLVFRRGALLRVLAPGTHFVPARLLPGTRLERVGTRATRFRHRLLDVIADRPGLRERLTVVDLAADERALVWRDGRLYDFVAGGRFAYWNAPYTLRVETFRATTPGLPPTRRGGPLGPSIESQAGSAGDAARRRDWRPGGPSRLMTPVPWPSSPAPRRSRCSPRSRPNRQDCSRSRRRSTSRPTSGRCSRSAVSAATASASRRATSASTPSIP